MTGDMPDMREEWNKEQKFYEETGALFMPQPFSQLYEDGITSAFDASSARQIERVREVADTVDATWGSNVTMVDLEWLRNRPKDDGLDIDLADDPYNFGTSLLDMGMPMNANASLMEYLNEWFRAVGSCLMNLKGKIKLELCLGDVTAVLEQIRYGVVGLRHQSTVFPSTQEDEGGITATLKPVR